MCVLSFYTFFHPVDVGQSVLEGCEKGLAKTFTVVSLKVPKIRLGGSWRGVFPCALVSLRLCSLSDEVAVGWFRFIGRGLR